jgi:hypothetical protein
VLRRSTAIDIPLDTGDFRLIDRKVVDALKKMPEQNKFLRGQIAWLGFRQGEVLFSRDKRRYGKTGYPLSKMLRFAMDGITAFSDRPLKLVTAMGFAISFLSFAIIVYAMYSHFVLLRTITGWTSLIISSTFIGGVQLLSIGIIGEYISRKLASAEWGDGVVDALARYLARTQPGLKGFTRPNLFRMRQFYDTYAGHEIVSALLRQLPWTHNLIILSQAKRPEEREFYLKMAIQERFLNKSFGSNCCPCIAHLVDGSIPYLSFGINDVHSMIHDIDESVRAETLPIAFEQFKAVLVC